MSEKKNKKEKIPRKETLLIFHYGKDYGGGDVFIENVLPALQQEYSVVLATVYPARRLKNKLNIKSYTIPVKKFYLFFGLFHFLYMLIRERVKILFVQDIVLSLYARFFQLVFFRLRQVVVIHANIGHFRYKLPFAQGIIKRLNRLTCVLVDRFVCISEYLARGLVQQGVAAAQMEVVYNGVLEPSAFPRAKTTGHLRIAFIGRLSHEKGIDYFLALARQSIERKERLEFHVFGAGEYAGQVKNMHALYPHQLYYHGFMTDIFKQFHIDVLVVPSRDEGTISYGCGGFILWNPFSCF